MLFKGSSSYKHNGLCTHSAMRSCLAARVTAVPARVATHVNAGSSAPGSIDEQSERPRPCTRRLFRSTENTDETPAATAAAKAAEAGSSGSKAADSARPTSSVSEDFRRAFEDLGVKPGAGRTRSQATTLREPTQPAADEAHGGSSSSRRRPRESGNSESDDYQHSYRDTDYERSYRDSRAPQRAGSYGNKSHSSGSSWQDRGGLKSTSASADMERRPRDEKQRQQWIAEAEERKRLAEEAERKRLLRKERSERIPTQPKKSQDPVIFQALERAVNGEWDSRMTQEELRGARAAARKVARVGLYDRNRSIRAIRRKLMRDPKAEDDPEAAALAASAARQIAEAAAKSIQPSKEELYKEAAGVKQDWSKAEALPAGEWERLQQQYLSNVTEVKIGRRGATQALAQQIHAVWRNAEVCKLRIHDEKSSRKMNLPRINLLLKELQEITGTGVVIKASGSSIWMYRGVNWVPPPKPVPYRPPPQHELFTQQHTPRGSWRDIEGVSCYVVSSSDAAELTSPPGSSSSDATTSSSVTDQMTVLLLPDQFPMADMPIMMQMADRVASKGALVVLPDVLGPDASSSCSSVRTQGQAAAGGLAGYWRLNWWPIVKKRKLEYFDWYNKGPASWEQQKPRLVKLLQEMQQQGMYSNGSVVAAAAGAGVVESSSSSGKPLGILGLGYGNYLAFCAAGDDECVAAGIQAVAAISPVTFMKDTDLATALQLPVALLPAKYDPGDVVAMTIDLLQRPYAPRCIFKRYGKVKPGWAHWLPQWQDARAMYQAAEQLLLSVAYLKRELLGIDDATIPPPLARGQAAEAAAAAGSQQKQQQDDHDGDDKENEEGDDQQQEQAVS